MKKFDAFSAACPAREILASVANKWTVLVLAVLTEGTTPPLDSAQAKAARRRWSAHEAECKQQGICPFCGLALNDQSGCPTHGKQREPR